MAGICRVVVGSSPINLGPRCFLEQETLPLLVSTGWFQDWIRVWFHNQTKINWGPYGKLMSNKPPRQILSKPKPKTRQ